jgi:hypothetical protein
LPNDLAYFLLKFRDAGISFFENGGMLEFVPVRGWRIAKELFYVKNGLKYFMMV